MAAPASSSQQQKQQPAQQPPPAQQLSRQAIQAISGALSGALMPTMAIAALKKLLPLFGIAREIKAAQADKALLMALRELERFTPPVQRALSFVQDDVIELNNERRAAYLANATRRIAEALAQAEQQGESPQDAEAKARSAEDRYHNQHVQASMQRTLAATEIDGYAARYGGLLGWYARHDDRTTAECEEADGKNFRVDNPPNIGYPGIVHMNCRCRPGPPHPGGEEMDGGTPTVIAAANYEQRVLEFVRHVRTEGGSEFYDEPIGAPITRKVREDAKRAHSNAVRRASRKGAVTQESGMRSRPVTRANDKRKAQGQTRSNFEHPFTGEPMTKTAIGDTYEELFARHGSGLLAKKFPGEYTPISGVEGGARNTPLDFKLDHLFGGELKTLSSRSQNQKTAIKKEEIDRKLRAVATGKLHPLLVVQVVDQDTGTVEVFAFPNFVSKAVRTMEYIGSYTYTNADFKAAAQAHGHWKE